MSVGAGTGVSVGIEVGVSVGTGVCVWVGIGVCVAAGVLVEMVVGVEGGAATVWVAATLAATCVAWVSSSAWEGPQATRITTVNRHITIRVTFFFMSKFSFVVDLATGSGGLVRQCVLMIALGLRIK